MNESTIRSLDDSLYDLRPYMRLIKESGFQGPVGFINFRIPGTPEDYLERTLTRWRELCLEVGLFESENLSIPRPELSIEGDDLVLTNLTPGSSIYIERSADVVFKTNLVIPPPLNVDSSSLRLENLLKLHRTTETGANKQFYRVRADLPEQEL